MMRSRTAATVVTGLVLGLAALAADPGSDARAQNSWGERGERRTGGDRRDEPGLVLYARPGYTGRNIALAEDVPDLARLGFDGQAASLRVNWGVWQVCENRNFRGRCARISRNARELSQAGIDSVASARLVESGRRDRDPDPSNREPQEGNDLSLPGLLQRVLPRSEPER